MPKPILYGTNWSPPYRAVLMVAKAINLELETKEVSFLAGDQMKPEFLAKNPQHTVPLLEDGDKIIWDSHAIITYLIGKYAKDDALYPKDLYKRALVDQRMHFDSGILFARLRGIFEPIIYFNEPVIPPEKIKALEDAYDFLNKFLAKDPYLVGDTITAADFCVIAAVSSTLGVLPVDTKKYPKLAAWMKRMEELPYYEEINGKYAKELIAFVESKRVH